MSDLAICPKCQGERYIKSRGEQIFLGIFTFGLAPAIDAVVNPCAKNSQFGYECPTCDGTGVINMKSRRRR